MAAFDYRQATEIRDALARHGVRYLFIGKAGAVLLGFPDTTQAMELFVDRSPGNGRVLVAALCELGFELTDEHARDIERAASRMEAVQVRIGAIRTGYELDAIAKERTVRGEFVRDVLEASLPVDEERRVIVTGLRALDGRTDLAVM